MAVKNQLKCKKVAFVNKLLPGQPTQYKLAMVTPVVVSREKFVENVVNHTGLNRTICRSVIDAIEECAGDYMELGNAVQLGADFGTLKPSIKVKAVATEKECTAETVQSISTKFIPTGNMRTRLAAVGFVVKGSSDGSDVDDSEVEVGDGGDNTPGGGGNTPSGGDNNTPSGGDTNTGGGTQTPTNRTITYKHQGATYTTQEYAVGAAVTAPSAPAGYQWQGVPSTMPDRDMEITSYADGGDDMDL